MCPFAIQQLTIYWTEIIAALTTLVASFGGAWFAFSLQNRKEKRREVNTNAEALNKIQITLSQQLNALTIFNKDFIQPHKNHPVNWIAVPAAPHRDYSKLQIDGGSLAFLVEKDSSTIISKVLVVEEKFKEVMNVINLRSNIHYQQLQPKLAEMGFIEGEPFNLSHKEVEILLGTQLVSALKRLTESLISSTEDAIKSHEEIITEIKTIGKAIFPNKRILSFEYMNKENQYNAANAADAKRRATD
ncbi:MAG: hypothetical protein KKF30_11070 [Proteobacteria bacterium]|nr:hypothetical protein [Pseudomonadota bacterium]MBU4469017.1 hypothetical protein [Pseudomonadota bacterium]MCG2750956.1 hypothetical protein [Desulfobacteraceae bacterium]